MRYGNFSCLIPEGREHGSGHVALEHGQIYQLRLGNHGPSRCDALVEVDGKSVGLFRINGYGTFQLERPSNDTGRFTFFRADSSEGQAAGATETATVDRGLVRVTFKPEKQQTYYRPAGPGGFVPRMGSVRPVRSGGPGGQSCGGQHGAPYEPEIKTCGSILGTTQTDSDVGGDMPAAGVTGLTGTSGQQFVTVAALDYDPTAEVVVTLRLVHEPRAAGVRKIVPSNGNPIPEPVE